MAFGRNSILAGALAAAVGIPVLIENSGPSLPESDQFDTGQIEAENLTMPAGHAQFIPVSDYREIFNFDMNPQSIRARWPRVSTIPADENLTALRVPLVTGTQQWDLQGSLTYYVDKNQRVRRILFRGLTGDASALAYFATEHLGFDQQKSNATTLFTKTQLFQTIGLLRLDEQNGLLNNHPGQTQAVVFEMNDPRSTLRLSRGSSLLLDKAITTVSR